MKYLLILTTPLFFIYCNSVESHEKKQPEKDKVNNSECSSYYPFTDGIIDLESLKTVFVDSSNFRPYFNECTIYKNHFTDDRFGFRLKKDSVLKDKYCSWEFVNPSKVKVTDPDYHVEYFDLPHEIFEDGKEVMPYTLANESGIVFIYDFPDSLHYHIYKMKYTGEIIGHLRIRHTQLFEETEAGSKKKSIRYERFLYPFDMRENHLVFSSDGWFTNEIRKTTVVNLDYLETEEYDFNLSAVIWDETEVDVSGFILHPGNRKISGTSSLKMYWKKDSSYTDLIIPYASDNCQTILWGNQLIVANWHPISTGSSLHSYDVNTKEKLWTADVLQMMVDHSKYYNKVTISKYKEKIILEGNEAFGDYLQIFDIKTGKRLAEFGAVVTKK